MFVCQCAAVTDREIAEAVQAGADTVSAVGHHTGAGTGCGGCHESIESLIEVHCGQRTRLTLVVA